MSACIECGCCDFVCPSHIPLVDWFRYGKGELRKQAIESEAVELARKRFEDREARLLRIKQERAQKMARRKQVLKNKTAQQERIQASIQRAENRNRSNLEVQGNGERDDT
ncbi:MAG: hypothetical protein OEU84_02145 [Xanthomonadales bacterium]|nr:hypothetical protein [Xanthomonadales bacterium]